MLNNKKDSQYWHQMFKSSVMYTVRWIQSGEYS